MAELTHYEVESIRSSDKREEKARGSELEMSAEVSSQENSKREMRRRKILDNAKSRMEKLKNTQKSLGSTAIDGVNHEVNPEVSEINPEVNNIPAVDHQEVDHQKRESGDEADPPDEIIPKLDSTPLPSNFTQPSIQPSIQPSSSILTPAVTRFTADKLWRLRTVLAVLCALVAVVVEVSLGLMYSNVVLMLVLDLTLLFYIFLKPHPSNQNELNNPLGKLSLLKVPLALVSSSWADWFDPVCLCVMLTGYMFRDLLIMIFLTIVFKLCITLVT